MLNPDNRLKYKSSIGFTDLLFNLVIGFVYLFVIAFILINPVAKQGDVEKKAEYIVVIEWNHEYNDDIDLWIKDPAGNIVSFLTKSSGLMNLEKDDLGTSNDSIVTNGDTKTIFLNREVVTLRGTIPGEYEVMAHVYNRKFTTYKGSARQDLPGDILVSVIKINPYVEAYTSKRPYSETGQNISLVRFSVADNNAYLGHNENPSDFITRKGTSGIGRSDFQGGSF
ncbi:MAG: hypothetical protein ISQ22_07145 [Rhizobiales bacterium]|nr:hypothetical protein [Hyphomicrobiales bacterium]